MDIFCRVRGTSAIIVEGRSETVYSHCLHGDSVKVKRLLLPVVPPPRCLLLGQDARNRRNDGRQCAGRTFFLPNGNHGSLHGQRERESADLLGSCNTVPPRKTRQRYLYPSSTGRFLCSETDRVRLAMDYGFLAVSRRLSSTSVV